MEGHSLISADVLASYAADAALGIDGVRRVIDGGRPRHHGVKVESDGAVAVELHLGVDWGLSVPKIGAAVQTRVAEYLERMADLTPIRVDVVIDEVGPPAKAA